MKNVSVLVSGCFISFLLVFTSNIRAGQVITDGIEASTRMAIDQEKTIEIGKCPSTSNTLPSFYIWNNSCRISLDSLFMGNANYYDRSVQIRKNKCGSKSGCQTISLSFD